MLKLVFLYNSRDESAVKLRDSLGEGLLKSGIDFWSDTRATDAGFDDELVNELGRSDAIVLTVGPSGLGRYQQRNELDRIVDAMQAQPHRRLVVARVDGPGAPPAELAAFAPFEARTASIEIADPAQALDQVRRAAFPGQVVEISTEQEAKLAGDIIGKVRTGTNLVVIVGPYAFAEAEAPQMTPSSAIRGFLRSRKLRGYAPWLDVMGSIARATAADEEDAAQAVVTALSNGSSVPTGLGVYLRLLAANLERTPGAGRLFVITTGPDLRVDMALRSARMPVQHLRLVHKPREEKSLFIERLTVEHGKIKRSEPIAADTMDDENDRVVLIKPFGCVESARDALLTAEHWRRAVTEMPLPPGMGQHLSRSVLLALGAGAFAPSFQFLFSLLLPGALRDQSGNTRRYLFHNPAAKVADPLHRIEAAILNPQSAEHELFKIWLADNYKLYPRSGHSISLLGWMDRHLNQPNDNQP